MTEIKQGARVVIKMRNQIHFSLKNIREVNAFRDDLALNHIWLLNYTKFKNKSWTTQT